MVVLATKNSVWLLQSDWARSDASIFAASSVKQKPADAIHALIDDKTFSLVILVALLAIHLNLCFMT